jgi:hypothetical protein
MEWISGRSSIIIAADGVEMGLVHSGIVVISPVQAVCYQ